ncbi:hypothetical protein SH528x_003195 [Novipirellula sp. SH528]|uniref:hypothetical protein n=1 Tax=Novipirellula sp. SH528 TaxID=3454466 RepID=UPI003F9F6F18
MMNPYSPPISRLDEHREVSRYGMVSLGLCVFGAVLTLPELWSNVLRPLDNPIGNAMGIAIIATTGLAAYVEWFPGTRLARLTVCALCVLAFVASVVIVRFVTSFVPVLTLPWVVEHPTVIMGFVFSLCSLLYIGLLCRRRVISQFSAKRG